MELATKYKVGLLGPADKAVLDGTATGATSGAAGTKGLVPAPSAGDQVKFLRGDMTYQSVTTGLSAASDAESKAGTETGKAVTPANLKAVLDMRTHNNNLIVNPLCQIWQWGAVNTLVKDTYHLGPDLFFGMATGTAVGAGTFGQTSAAHCGSTGFAAKLAGVSLTGTGIVYVRQRIESAKAIIAKNKTASLQVKVYHDVGSNINYTLTVRKANTANTFSATTVIQAGTATAVISATETTLKLEGISMGDCTNGIEIEVKAECGAITTKNFEFTEFKLELSELCTPIDLSNHSFNDELLRCMAYISMSYDYGVTPGTNTPTGGLQTLGSGDIGNQIQGWNFKVPMSGTPSVVVYAGDGTSGAVTKASDGTVISSVGAYNIGREGFRCVLSGSTPFVSAQYYWQYYAYYLL